MSSIIGTQFSRHKMPASSQTPFKKVKYVYVLSTQFRYHKSNKSKTWLGAHVADTGKKGRGTSATGVCLYWGVFSVHH